MSEISWRTLSICRIQPVNPQGQNTMIGNLRKRESATLQAPQESKSIAPSSSSPAAYQGLPETRDTYGTPLANPQSSYSHPSPAHPSNYSYLDDFSTGYGEQQDGIFGLNLAAILIPILTLLGFSLLFPTYVNIESRKKRSLGECRSKKNTSALMGQIKHKSHILSGTVELKKTGMGLGDWKSTCTLTMLQLFYRCFIGK